MEAIENEAVPARLPLVTASLSLGPFGAGERLRSPTYRYP